MIGFFIVTGAAEVFFYILLLLVTRIRVQNN